MSCEISEKEKAALVSVGMIADDYGYGNVISYLKRRWLVHLERNGLKDPPDSAADALPYCPGIYDMIGSSVPKGG